MIADQEAPGGIVGFDWVWVGLAAVADIGMYAGGSYGNRDCVLDYLVERIT
jgi:hypothetical protein